MKRYIIAFFALIAGYLLFACLSCLLPSALVRRNVEASVYSWDIASDYPKAAIQREHARMDNFTDALILNQAYTIGDVPLLEGMMMVPRADNDEVEQTAKLWRVLQGDVTHTYTYARYWHGSTFLMRFLLLFASYPTIRLWFYFLSSLMLLWLAVELYQKGGVLPVVAVVAAFVLSFGYIMQFSIQFFPVWMLTMAISLCVCRNYQDARKTAFCFFVIGSLVAFFDLLTVPLLTLTIPLLLFVYLVNNEKDRVGMPRQLGQVAVMGGVWLAGYALTWAGKWAIATAVCRVNVFEDAIGSASIHSGMQEEFSRWDAVFANMAFLPWRFLIVVVAATLILAILRPRKGGWRTALLLLAVAILPYLWYFALSIHSYFHCWFTYRNQMATLLGVFLAGLCMVRRTQ